MKTTINLLVATLFGVGLGAYLFSDSQPRSLIGVGKCARNCYRMSDIAGLVASIGIQRIPKAIPLVVRESDQCIAIRHPYSPHRFHFVLFPKRDIRNIGEIAAGDEPYVIDCLAVLRELVTQHKLTSYRVYSNGPAQQDISYLHFHLVAD